MKQRQFFCVSCNRRVTCPADEICFKRLKNRKVRGGVPALKCHCGKCDQTLYKFVKHKDASKLKKKYGSFVKLT